MELLERLFSKVTDVVPWWVIAPIALVLFVITMQRFFWAEEKRPERRYRGPAEGRASRHAGPVAPAVTNTVYDRAANHLEGGNFPAGLKKEQAYVHTGMYLAWVVERGLAHPGLGERLVVEIESVHDRSLTGAGLYEALGGEFDSTMLSDDGDAFTAAYFDFETGDFLEDYAATLAGGLPSLYHVADAWENYDALCAVLDRRYLAWQRVRA